MDWAAAVLEGERIRVHLVGFSPVFDSLRLHGFVAAPAEAVHGKERDQEAAGDLLLPQTPPLGFTEFRIAAFGQLKLHHVQQES